MGKAPVKRAPVKDPKKPAVLGAKVTITAPRTSGTIIIPPGTRSTARLIGTCISTEGSVLRVRFALPGGSAGALGRGGRNHRSLAAPAAETELTGVARRQVADGDL